MKKVNLLLMASMACATVSAQKLPAVQQTSLRAPANIKIDGKATEWGNKFEADNPTTELLYSIANDDKNLYLVAQTSVDDVYNRISNGGIKFIVQKNGRRSDEGACEVKFPFQEKPGIWFLTQGGIALRWRPEALILAGCRNKKPFPLSRRILL